MSDENKGFKIFLFVSVIFLIIAILFLYYYDSTNSETSIDNVSQLPEPHLSGDIIVEVDYFDSCEIDNDVFNDVTEIFEDYGINVTFIIDDEFIYIDEIDDSDVHDYYDQYNDLDTDTYMLIASSKDNSNILGSAFSKDESVIYYESIEDHFGNNYKENALKYVIIHEILHQYGCDHSDDNDDVMYAYLSLSRVILNPDPEITDSETLVELLD